MFWVEILYMNMIFAVCFYKERIKQEKSVKKQKMSDIFVSKDVDECIFSEKMEKRGILLYVIYAREA